MCVCESQCQLHLCFCMDTQKHMFLCFVFECLRKSINLTRIYDHCYFVLAVFSLLFSSPSTCLGSSYLLRGLETAGQVLHSWIQPLCCCIVTLEPVDDHHGNRGPPLGVWVAAWRERRRKPGGNQYQTCVCLSVCLCVLHSKPSIIVTKCYRNTAILRTPEHERVPPFD